MNKCNVIRDLLPLYADKVCSEDSREMVEEHLSTCQECKQELEDYCYNTGIEEVSPELAMKNFKKKMGKRNFKKIVISVIVCLAIILGGAYMLFVPEFVVPYSDDLLTAKIPVDEGVDVWVNLPNYTNVYSKAIYNENDEFDVYLTVTQNLWSMIMPDSDKANNFWRTNGFVGASFQASDDMPFKESDVKYFSTKCEIVSIHYAEFDSSPTADIDMELSSATYNETATTHLIWSASESE